MFENKLMNMALIILIAISLLGSTAFVLYQYFLSDSAAATSPDKPEKLTAEELMERTIQTKEFRTNLADGKYILIRFAFQLNTTKAKDELEKRNVQLESAIVSVLASTNSSDIEGEAGLIKLETILLNRVNEFLEKGKVVRVYITDKLLQ